MVERVLFGDIFKDDAKIVGTEQEFNFEIEKDSNKYIVNGIIDLIIQSDEDTIEIVDYKTGRHKLSYNAAEKDIQLMLYYLAAKKLYPKAKYHMVTIMYLNGGIKQITPAFGNKTEDAVINRVMTVWKAISQDKKPYRIADNRDGSVTPKHPCKYLCDFAACETIYPEFIKYINNGGDIENLKTLEDLGFKIK